MNKRPLQLYEFGSFRLNATERLLYRDDDVVPLTPKVLDTLLVLVENSGHVVDKNELMQTLWPDSFVEESSLSQNISLLRRALGEAGDGCQYIETLPKRGYRFVVDVRQVKESDTEVVMSERTTTEIIVEAEEHRSTEFTQSRVQEAALVKTRRRLGLKSYLTAGSIMVMAIAAAIFLYARGSKTEDYVPRSIAILPFENINNDRDTALLDLGIVDALVVRLSALDHTTVLPTSSVFKYADHKEDDFTIGKELGVDAVLDGTLQRDGDSVRVSAQLIRLSDGKIVWSEKFDQPDHGVFAVQDAISARLANALSSHIPQTSPQRRFNRTTQSPEAYQAYLMGLYFWNMRTKENVGKAIDYLEQAVKMDPDFAQAHAVLADSYYLSIGNNWNILPAREAYTKATAHAKQALDLDDGIAEAHIVKADLLFMYRIYDDAEREFHRALELDPRCAVAHLRYGYFLLASSKISEAVDEMKRARELDPVSPTANLALGYLLSISRDYDGAIKCYERALEIQPDMPGAHINLGEAYLQKGMLPEARTEFEKLKDHDPLSFTVEMISFYALSGDHEKAMQLLSELRKSSAHDQVVPFEYAAIYATLNDKDAAFEWLEKINACRLNIAQVKLDPEFDALKTDPRFDDWLKRNQD
jgi:DNA-binding winged helix-turn-helix (wHTH) protein/TolB-like protein/Flp pilus assembly protein TadD